MSDYKVPQDVEADDKLLGPFSFRQFVYLFVAVGLCALEWLFISLGGLMIFLAIFPLPVIVLFGALALPLKKDQPMETYLAAIVSFYLKPKVRLWKADGKEHVITITAPKKQEVSRTKDLSEEEAERRLAFLANVVDTEGQVVKNANVSDELNQEAATVTDMFEDSTVGMSMVKTVEDSEAEHHAEIIENMRKIIAEQEQEVEQSYGGIGASVAPTSVVVDPTTPPVLAPVEPEPVPAPQMENPDTSAVPVSSDIIESLASSPDLSVETLSKIAKQKEDEVFVAISHNNN
ncbi:MAG: PrgI family protein [Candidatus Nomurabacteria bacterium]|jgi:hypothetical protein|nr:PrgI family protein [Candidatus Nomurabacteria bacterium]